MGDAARAGSGTALTGPGGGLEHGAPGHPQRPSIAIAHRALCPALQVVGLTSGYHTAGVMATKGSLMHARRICQASALRLSLRAGYERPDGDPSHVYLQVCAHACCTSHVTGCSRNAVVSGVWAS